MLTATINIATPQNDTCPDLTVTSGSGVVNIKNIQQLEVDEDETVTLTFTGENLNEIQFAPLNQPFGSARNTPFSVGPVDVDGGLPAIKVEDHGATAGTWKFRFKIGRRWYDPQIYNKGTEGGG